MTNYWKRLKSYPYLYHLVLIAGVVAGLLLAAHFAMQLGTRHGQHRTVPDFTGLALDDAGRLAQPTTEGWCSTSCRTKGRRSRAAARSM